MVYGEYYSRIYELVTVQLFWQLGTCTVFTLISTCVDYASIYWSDQFAVISGKDKIIFVTKEDHEAPSNAELVADDPNDPYEEHGESKHEIFKPFST